MLIAVAFPFTIMAALVCYNRWFRPTETGPDDFLQEKKKRDLKAAFVHQLTYLVSFYFFAALVYLVITNSRISDSQDYVTTTTGRKYSISHLTGDIGIYTDRNYLLPPDSLERFKNYTIISTANEDKTISDDDIFTIRIPRNTRLSVFVVHDSRAETPALGGIPDWLSKQGFKYKPGLIVKTTDRQAVYHVYGKEISVKKDTICSFGGNLKNTDRVDQAAYSMYFVLLNQPANEITNANILRGMSLKQSTSLIDSIDILNDKDQLLKPANPVWDKDILHKKIVRHQLWLTGDAAGRLDLNENIADSKMIVRNLVFDHVNISHADLIGDSVCLSQFNTSILQGTEFFKTRLFSVDFFNSILDSANFNQAIIRNCRFFGLTSAGPILSAPGLIRIRISPSRI
jgi:hypothetical protein